jgi:hypothetical protein
MRSFPYAICFTLLGVRSVSFICSSYCTCKNTRVPEHAHTHTHTHYIHVRINEICSAKHKIYIIANRQIIEKFKLTFILLTSVQTQQKWSRYVVDDWRSWHICRYQNLPDQTQSFLEHHWMKYCLFYKCDCLVLECRTQTYREKSIIYWFADCLNLHVVPLLLIQTLITSKSVVY